MTDPVKPGPAPLPAATVARLRDCLSGSVLTAADAGYAEARRVWNGAVDRHPLAIIRCTGREDVAAGLRFAQECELRMAVRGGGHGVAGLAVCDSGETPRRGPGFGLPSVSRGRCPWGPDRRPWPARRSSPDGPALTASEAENPDLFWGLRGGGGNFGVVTSFEYRLHPVGPQVLAGPIFYALDDAPRLLRFYRDWVADAPDGLATVLNLRRAPAAAFLPAAMHGRPVVGVVTFFAGRIEDGEEALRPLRRFGRPLVDLVGPKPYLLHQSMFDPLVPHGWHYYWKSCDHEMLTDDLIDVLVGHTEAITSPHSYTLLFRIDGVAARVPADQTAYSHRSPRYMVNVNAAWTPDDPDGAAHIGWARDFYAALEPGAVGAYVNFLGDEGAARVRTAYSEPTYQRLQALKKRYDPTNVFRLNQNVHPGA